MYLYNYILLAGFACLLLSERTRLAACVFLAGWAIYSLLVFDAPVYVYYVAVGTIEATMAYILNKRFRVVAYLGYSLIIVNIYGLLLYKNGISPLSYDVIYALISITQFMFLLIRALPSGISGLHSKHILVRCTDFDSRKACGTMYKSTPTGKTNQ